MTAAVAHNAQVRHRASGFLRWGWECPCGDGEWVKGEDDARQSADGHNKPPAPVVEVVDFIRKRMTCRCYLADEMEFADEPCARCTLLRLLQGGTE